MRHAYAVVIPIVAVIVLSACRGNELDTRQNVSSVTYDTCPPEPITYDSSGQPRNAAGNIRYCWPGEAYCHCDSDNDCYAQQGYIPCNEVTAANATTCPPEPTTLDANGEPRNSYGRIRYCWPGEAYCACDAWDDCYARTGYVACTPSVDAGSDSSVDAGSDSSVDAGSDSSVDAGSDSSVDAGTDSSVDAKSDASLDTGVDAPMDAADAGPCPPEPVTYDASGQPRNAAGHIRYCWPGEAYCHCDADNDCYAEQGYIPCNEVTAANATSCPPEPTTLDASGQPRNAYGRVRYCWPGEAYCHCDSWDDCYAQTGYVPCSQRSDAGVSDGSTGGTDAGVDSGTDSGTDSGAPDGGVGPLGSWSPVFPWPFPAVHANLLPNGLVLAWTDGANSPQLWNPATGAFTVVNFTRTELHCSGQAFLSDGRLLLAGGEAPGTTDVGVVDTNVYDYRTNTFTSGPNMLNARWYPTETTLPDGEVLIMAGDTGGGTPNPQPEIWTTSATLRELTSAVMPMDTYPFMFVLQDGRVFHAGPDPVSHFFSPSGTGAWTVFEPSLYGERSHGTAAMYDNGKVLMVGGVTLSGGVGTPTATAEVVDLTAATPHWRYTNPMHHPRAHLNATLLPDGTVLVTGGSTDAAGTDAHAVLSAEIWNPSTEVWTELSSEVVPRLYHSTALLMVDGSVLVAGGESDIDHRDAEIFYPPYLFQGTRPSVTSAPASVTYGAGFFVGTPDAASITRASFVRLGAVTHSYNQSQRINRLAFSVVSGGIQITAPATASLCPPGYYLLFLVNGNGVPSVARVVQIL